MSSIVKLNATRVVHYFDMSKLSAFCETTLHRNGFALELSGARVLAASGEKAGQEVEGGIVKANQRVYIPMGILHPQRYTAFVDVHPELLAMGDVSCIRMAEPREDTPFVLRLKANAECNPRGLPWLVRIYLLD